MKKIWFFLHVACCATVLAFMVKAGMGIATWEYWAVAVALIGVSVFSRLAHD